MARMTDERLAEIDVRYDTETNLEWLRNAVHKLLQALKEDRDRIHELQHKYDALVVKLKAKASAWEILEKTVGIDGNQAAHQLRALLENNNGISK